MKSKNKIHKASMRTSTWLNRKRRYSKKDVKRQI